MTGRSVRNRGRIADIFNGTFGAFVLVPSCQLSAGGYHPA